MSKCERPCAKEARARERGGNHWADNNDSDTEKCQRMAHLGHGFGACLFISGPGLMLGVSVARRRTLCAAATGVDRSTGDDVGGSGNGRGGGVHKAGGSPAVLATKFASTDRGRATSRPVFHSFCRDMYSVLSVFRATTDSVMKKKNKNKNKPATRYDDKVVLVNEKVAQCRRGHEPEEGGAGLR